jgi:FSR family fosmidomycin resistance protein-like MFS transporter
MPAQSPTASSPETTVAPVIFAVAFGHFLNDLMQSLIPAGYPLLKDNLDLSFTQIGLITLVFQGTASILQPLIGLYTDSRTRPKLVAWASRISPIPVEAMPADSAKGMGRLSV